MAKKNSYEGVDRTMQNAAQTLLANIRFASVDDPVRSIVVTSSIPNEGKTTISIELAKAMAKGGRTVLLVECDMRRRSMASVLGAHAQYGLYAVVAGEIPLTQAAVATDTPNLYFLDAEPHIPNPSDLLNSHRFSRLIEIATKTFDYVVFDTPPVGTFVDAAVLGTKVDAVFMVVREGFTKKAEVAAAAEQLKKSGCNLAGVVMNYCERRSSEYYYEYYYSKEGHKDEDAPTIDAIKTVKQVASKVSLPQRPARRTEQAAEVAAEAPASTPVATQEPVQTPAVSTASLDETSAFLSAAQRSARHVNAASIPSVIDEDE